MHGLITRLGENPKTRCNSDSSYDNGILFNGELAHPLQSAYRQRGFIKPTGP
jgi:hypothetical protein